MNTDADLEAGIPYIAWREPIPVSSPTASGLGCRLCIARNGLRAADVGALFQTVEEHQDHIASVHPKEQP